MSTTEERRITGDNVNKLIPLACNGNKHAEKYLASIAWATRIIDDLYDKDVQVKREDIEKLFYILLIEIPTNPFFLQNFQSLISQHIVIYNAWIDSNKWQEELNVTKRLYAHVVRDYIGELVPFIAFLTGGSESMRKISLVARETFMKEFP